MKKTLFLALFSLIFTTAYSQSKDIRKFNATVCDCIEKIVENEADTLLLEEATEKCITSHMATKMSKSKKFMKKHKLSTSEGLKDFMTDRTLDAFTTCEYSVKTGKVIRDFFNDVIYDGTESEVAKEQYIIGTDKMVEGDYREAIKHFKIAVKEDTSFVEAYDHLGVCYRRLEEFKDAEKYYKISEEIAPYGTFATQNLAVVYTIQKDYAGAINQYQRLINLDMSNPEGYYGAAIILIEVEDYPQAMRFCEMAINIYETIEDDHLPDGYFMKGLIFLAQDDKKNARKWIEKAEKMGRKIPAGIKRDL